MKSSLLQQSYEAKLMLVQILLASAEGRLSEEVSSERGRKAREEAVEKIAYEAHEVLGSLETSTTTFVAKHEQNLRVLRQKLVSIVRRARDSTFYQKVSMEELRTIKIAMQAEFHGSGHWYRCANGHSYSIGECGMAMEQTSCPECGAPVGGANHSFVVGNVHDARMDAL